MKLLAATGGDPAIGSWTWSWGQIVRGAGGVIFVLDRPIQLSLSLSPPIQLRTSESGLPDADCSASLGAPCPHPPSPPANHRGRGGVPCMQVAQRKASQPRHVGEIPGVRGRTDYPASVGAEPDAAQLVMSLTALQRAADVAVQGRQGLSTSNGGRQSAKIPSALAKSSRSWVVRGVC